jgi:hypothetical protein
MQAAEKKAQAEQDQYNAQMAAEEEAKRKRLQSTADLSRTGAGSRYGNTGSLLTPQSDLTSLFT